MFTTSQTLDKVYYKEIKVWHYSLAEFDRAAELLESVDWDSLLPHVNTYWSAWKNYFMQIMEICIPHSVVKVKRNLLRVFSKQSGREILHSALLSELASQWIMLNTKPSVTKL